MSTIGSFSNIDYIGEYGADYQDEIPEEVKHTDEEIDQIKQLNEVFSKFSYKSMESAYEHIDYMRKFLANNNSPAEFYFTNAVTDNNSTLSLLFDLTFDKDSDPSVEVRVMEEFGKGSFKQNYKAIDLKGKKMAVSRTFYKNQAELECIKDEYFNNFALRDVKGCVTFKKALTSQDSVVFISPFCDGGTLQDRIKEGRLTTDLDIIECILPLAKTIQEMHEKKKMVHLDIKPDNIMFKSKKEKIKLIDLGSARVVGDKGINGLALTPVSHTPQEKLKKDILCLEIRVLKDDLKKLEANTPEFEAVSQKLNDKTAEMNELVNDYKVDIFSLGVTLFQCKNNNALPSVCQENDTLFRGTKAVTTKQRLEILEKLHQNMNTEKSVVRLSGFSTGLDVLIGRMTQNNPKDRPTIGEVVTALERISKEENIKSRFISVKMNMEYHSRPFSKRSAVLTTS